MKILFSSRPAYGHLYPMMPLAEAARAAGHEVVFSTAGSFVPKLRALGFPSYDVGLTIAEAMELAGSTVEQHGDDGRPDLDFGGRLFIDVLGRATARDLVPLLPRLAPDLVVYEQGEFGAAVVARAAGIPVVLHSISPRMPQQAIDVVLRPRLERLWADHGVPSAPIDAFTGDTYLDIFPTAMQDPAFLADPARLRMRPVPYAEPTADAPGWLGAIERPLVYLTLGTVVATDERLQPAIEGLGALDAEVLVALGSADGAALGPLPDNVRVEAFVDQQAVLRRAALAVHHGGSGTVLGAIAAGVPQLLLPKGADQFLNADVLARGELASVLEPHQATPEATAAAAGAEMARHRPAADAARRELATMPTTHDVLATLVARFDRPAAA